MAEQCQAIDRETGQQCTADAVTDARRSGSDDVLALCRPHYESRRLHDEVDEAQPWTS